MPGPSWPKVAAGRVGQRGRGDGVAGRPGGGRRGARPGRGADERAAGRAVRHRLEAGGDRCLLVFDNATDPGLLRPFIPAAGAARVIITSNQRVHGRAGHRCAGGCVLRAGGADVPGGPHRAGRRGGGAGAGGRSWAGCRWRWRRPRRSSPASTCPMPPTWTGCTGCPPIRC